MWVLEMNIPDCFIYRLVSAQKEYRRDPPGNPDVLAMIEGKPCWVSPMPKRLDKKKTLVFADWTASAWSLEKSNQVRCSLIELMKQGFVIYRWDEGKVTLLDSSHLLSKNFSVVCKKMTLASAQNITQAAVNQNKTLSIDEVQLLDYYWINHLISGEKEPGPRVLRTSELMHLMANVSNEKLDDLIELLLSSSPKLEKIIHDTFDEESNIKANQLKDILQRWRISMEYCYASARLKDGQIDIVSGITEGNLTLDVSQLKNLNTVNLCRTQSNKYIQFILVKAPNLKKIDLSKCDHLDVDLNLKPVSLTNLEEISLSSRISVQNLQALFNAAPNLIKIDLSQCIHLDVDLNLKPVSLTNLEEISLSHNISARNLQIFFKAAPNLKRINLSFCGYSYVDLDLESASLINLEEISLMRSNFSARNLQALFKAAPNLKKIDLSRCNHLNVDLDLEPASLINLEEISLNDSNISSRNLQALFNAAANLKKIYLSGCQHLNVDLVLEPASLTNLEEISLRCANITAPNLQALFKAAPNLKKIDLCASDSLDVDLNLKPASLTKLEEIDLTHTNITARNLQTLFTAAPNLKKINLYLCKHLDDDLGLDPASLTNLEEINLKESNISSRNLQALFKVASNLKKIDLYECDSLDVDLDLKPASLTNLEEIRLTRNITARNLQALFAAALNLKKIDVSGCKHLDNDLVLEQASLTTLEEIDLTLTNITARNLQTLFTAALNLKKINLYGCKHLDNDLVLEPASLTTLEEINLNESNISARNLQALFTAAPNLKKINLYGCQHLDNDLDLESAGLTNLEEINLKESNISSRNLQALFKAAPNLKKINLDRCQHLDIDLDLEPASLKNLEEIELFKSIITSQSMEALRKAAPNLQRIDGVNIVKSAMLAQNPNGPFSQSERVPSKSFDEELPKENPIHDAQKMKDFVLPKGYEKPRNQTKNQGMIIQRLGDYVTLTQKNRDILPKLEGGICVALSHYFSEMKVVEWDRFINMALAWNGQDPVSKDLSAYFDNLYAAIQTYQFSQSRQQVQYLGDELSDFLSSNYKPCILVNPWHAIAMKPADNPGHWHVYDPNYVTGFLTVRTDRLLSTIHEAIGTLVSIESEQIIKKVSIKSQDNFIANGGLLCLNRVANADALLAKLSIDHHYTKDALDGILSRNTKAYPAWAVGLESRKPEVSKLTLELLKQFLLKNPADGHQQLTRSLSELTPLQKGDCITALIKCDLSSEVSSSANPSPIMALISDIRESTKKDLYEKALQTWNKTAESAPNYLAYSQACLQTVETKRLIELETTQQVDTLRYLLEQQAKISHRPVYYIDKPDDLVCSSPWLEIADDNKGTLRKGPGGPLYDFLRTNTDTSPLLIVNYEGFNADDIVRFNGLLDKDPHADGTPLPKNTMIIGLMNRNKPGCYQGSDFYSRFTRTEHCPLSPEELDAIKPKNTVEVSREMGAEKIIINLYHAPDWKDRLLGRWVLNGDAIEFCEGALVKAMVSGKPIEIQNGFWGEKQFERFWQQATTHGVRHGGRIIRIPDAIKLIRPEFDTYQWLNPPTITEKLSNDPNAIVLNPTTLINFLGPYKLIEGKLVKEMGLLEQASKNPIPLVVNVTRSLNDDSWAMLMDECYRLGVALTIHCANEVVCPASFKVKSPLPNGDLAPAENPSEGDWLYTSTDMDTTLAQLTRKPGEYLVFDVSECTPSDLLTKLDASFNKDTLTFTFSQTNSALTTALSENKKVILKGHFSNELWDSLAPLLQARQHQKADGQIILITQDEKAGAFISSRRHHSVSAEDKLRCLTTNSLSASQEESKEDSSRDALIMEKLRPYVSEPLPKLQARYNALQANQDIDWPWLGMNSLTNSLQQPQNSAQNKAFTEERLAKVNAALDKAPYVFLTGLSGVGKSTFVEKELSKTARLYHTEASMVDWASDDTAQRKILFIDEANLSPRQWSEFEGLYHTPPTVLIHGKCYTLSPHHKVVFAGNPVNYGDERALAPFFQHHGNALLFSPLPPATIEEEILNPIFEKTEISPKGITNRILDIYCFICECSTTDVLITPRELEMMALLTISRAKKYPQQSIEDMAAHVSYELAKHLVPKKKQSEFDGKFRPNSSMSKAVVEDKQDKGFLITPSRLLLSQQLDNLLDLRQLRREDNSVLSNPSQRAGGLGGMIIEGEPGIGKSDLVIAQLRARNFQEEKDLSRPSTKKNPFYKLSVSMSTDEKEALLIKAFKEGAVVIIDEINSSSMMERLLNDLLMGKNPKGVKEDRVTPGFMIIGTQNPVTMSGRRAISSALQRRLMTRILPEYTPEEMRVILCAKGVNEQDAKDMVDAYEKNRSFALEKKLSPPPNFRNLMSLAERHLKSVAPLQQEVEAKSQDHKPQNLPHSVYVREKSHHVPCALPPLQVPVTILEPIAQIPVKAHQEVKETASEKQGLVESQIKIESVQKDLFNKSLQSHQEQFNAIIGQLEEFSSYCGSSQDETVVLYQSFFKSESSAIRDAKNKWALGSMKQKLLGDESLENSGLINKIEETVSTRLRQ